MVEVHIDGEEIFVPEALFEVDINNAAAVADVDAVAAVRTEIPVNFVEVDFVVENFGPNGFVEHSLELNLAA